MTDWPDNSHPMETGPARDWTRFTTQQYVADLERTTHEAQRAMVAAEAKVAEARSALGFIGMSPWTERDHPSAAYARSALATLAGEDDG